MINDNSQYLLLMVSQTDAFLPCSLLTSMDILKLWNLRISDLEGLFIQLNFVFYTVKEREDEKKVTDS